MKDLTSKKLEGLYESQLAASLAKANFLQHPGAGKTYNKFGHELV
ncbi:hypothetical protein ACIFOT_13025 [Neobacillus sp. NRS-1170]